MRPSAQFYENLNHIHMPNNTVHFSNIQNNKYRKTIISEAEIQKEPQLGKQSFLFSNPLPISGFYSPFGQVKRSYFLPFFFLPTHSCSYRTKGQFPVQSACTGYPLKHHPTY